MTHRLNIALGLKDCFVLGSDTYVLLRAAALLSDTYPFRRNSTQS